MREQMFGWLRFFYIRSNFMIFTVFKIGMHSIKIDTENSLCIIGPANEPVAKIADMYRKVIYVKQEDVTYLLRMKKQLYEA